MGMLCPLQQFFGEVCGGSSGSRENCGVAARAFSYFWHLPYRDSHYHCVVCSCKVTLVSPSSLWITCSRTRGLVALLSATRDRGEECSYSSCVFCKGAAPPELHHHQTVGFA